MAVISPLVNLVTALDSTATFYQQDLPALLKNASVYVVQDQFKQAEKRYDEVIDRPPSDVEELEARLGRAMLG